MTDNDTVNSMITDAVAQSTLVSLGVAPAVAAGAMMQSLAQAMAAQFQNAVTNQQTGAMLQQAVTAQGVQALYSLNTMGAATATAKLGHTDPVAQLQSLVSLAQALQKSGG